MKTEIRINGKLTVELIPETELEAAVLDEMRQKAANGQPVTIGSLDLGMTVSVAK